MKLYNNFPFRNLISKFGYFIDSTIRVNPPNLINVKNKFQITSLKFIIQINVESWLINILETYSQKQDITLSKTRDLMKRYKVCYRNSIYFFLASFYVLIFNAQRSLEL